MKMQTTKRLLALLLTLTMLVGVAAIGGASAFATEIPNITMELSDTDRQLNLIYAQRASLRQADGENTWYYAVTDLDHDGSLEFIAASQHPQNRSTNLRVWEVSADRNSLTECSISKDAEESFPDILTDVADTYHNLATDTWYYMLYDNIVLSNDEVYTIKTAINLKNGVISYDAFAIEYTVVVNGRRNVSHTDATGVAISPEQYNASGNDALAGTARSSTNFEWLTAADTDDLTKLTASFAVFMGQKAPTEYFPVPRPVALNAPPATEATAAPAATPAPVQQPVYLSVTKNPTNENRTQGDTAYFVSSASAYESLAWTFVSPDGGEYSSQSFAYMFADAPVNGQSSTTLSIGNVAPDMNGWGAYCTFYYKGQTARTTTAYLYVSEKKSGAPSGNYDGTVIDWNYSSVTINVANSVTVTIPWGICDVDGDLYYGAYASVYYDGANVTYCHVYGNIPSPEPIYGSMSGTAYEGGGGYAIYLNNGTQVYIDSWLCNVSGTFYDGASCVVYYVDRPYHDNIYAVDIYGSYYDDDDDWAALGALALLDEMGLLDYIDYMDDSDFDFLF